MFASRVLSRRATRQLVRTRQFGAQAQEYEGMEKTVRTYLPKDEHVSALYNFTPPHTHALGFFLSKSFPFFLSIIWREGPPDCYCWSCYRCGTSSACICWRCAGVPPHFRQVLYPSSLSNRQHAMRILTFP